MKAGPGGSEIKQAVIERQLLFPRRRKKRERLLECFVWVLIRVIGYGLDDELE